MCEILWNDQEGWSAPVIKPLTFFNLHPFNSCIHYAFSCYEGMKVFKGKNDEIYLFRPQENMD